MVPIDAIIQETLLVLRDPAWQGVGVIMSSALALCALHCSRHSSPTQYPIRLSQKKYVH